MMSKYLVVLLLTVLAFTSTTQAASNLECEFCDFVVNYVEKFVSSGKSEQYIIQEAEKICNFVPESLNSTCETLISSYLPEIISYISNDEPASVICAKINMCSSDSTEEIEVGGAVECSICDFVISYVEKYVAQNSTESQIQAFLDKDCSILGGLSTTCQSLVNAYLPQIIEKLQQKEPASTICAQIKLCSSEVEEKKEEPCPQAVGDLVGCTVCQLIVKYTEGFVENNQTESVIIQELETACNSLPSDWASLCDSMVSSYAPVIIKDILNSQTPTQICDAIGFCGNSGSSSADNSSSAGSVNSESSQTGSATGSATGSMSGSGSGAAFRVNFN